jgi:anti-anti-sigma regulatory factor
MTETFGRMTLDAAGDQLVLGGAIDETSQLLDVLARAKQGRLALDLAGVTFINSLGVRDWIRMQAAATKDGVRVELRRVSEPIVHQLNMIIATRGTSTVTSFFAPYACDSCGREDTLLVDAVAHAATLAKLVAPLQTCPECKSAMAFNDFPERYFSFLAASDGT